MKKYLALLLLLPRLAFAADGAEITSSMRPTGMTKDDYPSTYKLCDTHTGATDCGPVLVPFPTEKIAIFVYRLTNAGNDCTFDNWNIYQLPDTNTAATYGKPALFTLDDDGTGGLTGVSAGARLDYNTNAAGTYYWIDAGTLGTCSDFTVLLQSWPKR